MPLVSYQLIRNASLQNKTNSIKVKILNSFGFFCMRSLRGGVRCNFFTIFVWAVKLVANFDWWRSTRSTISSTIWKIPQGYRGIEIRNNLFNKTKIIFQSVATTFVSNSRCTNDTNRHYSPWTITSSESGLINNNNNN